MAHVVGGGSGFGSCIPNFSLTKPSLLWAIEESSSNGKSLCYSLCLLNTYINKYRNSKNLHNSFEILGRL